MRDLRIDHLHIGIDALDLVRRRSIGEADDFRRGDRDVLVEPAIVCFPLGRRPLRADETQGRIILGTAADTGLRLRRLECGFMRVERRLADEIPRAQVAEATSQFPASWRRIAPARSAPGWAPVPASESRE